MTQRVGRFAAPLAIVATILLNACGGGGSGPLPGASPSPTNNPISGKTASVQLTMDMPGGTTSSSRTAGTRHAQYIDTANSTQLVITVASVNGTALNQTQSYSFNSGTNCNGATPPVCTYSTTLPVGNDVIQFTLEDTNNRPLAQSVVTANITQGTNNVQTTLNGIVAALNSPTCGTATFQADGQHIPVTWGQTTGNAAAADVDQNTYLTTWALNSNTATTGGTLTSGTYRYLVTFTDSSSKAAGATVESTIVVPNTTTTNVVNLTFTAPSNAANYTLYRTAAGGASYSESKVVTTGTVTSGSGTAQDTGAATTSGTPTFGVASGAFIGTPGQYAATSTSDSAQSLNPITISSTNPNAKFSINGAAAANPATIKGSADNVVLIYSGSQIAGTNIPITIGASVPNSVPGNSQVAQVTSNTCQIQANSSVTAPPTTTLSVSTTGNWVLQNGYGAAQQSNPYNVDCFAPPTSSSITINDAQCYYTVTGSLTSFTGKSTGIQYVMNYTGSVLLNYWNTTSGAVDTSPTPASMSGTYYFTDTNNPSNTFTGVLSGSFVPSTYPTDATNGQVNASEDLTTTATTWTFTITGTGGAFSGVSGTLTMPANTFRNVRDTSYPQQFDYTSQGPLTGTLNGI